MVQKPHDELMNFWLICFPSFLLTVTVSLCIELQSIFPVCQFALDGRLICIACSSIGNWFAKFWYAVRLEFWETVVVLLLSCTAC